MILESYMYTDRNYKIAKIGKKIYSYEKKLCCMKIANINNLFIDILKFC